MKLRFLAGTPALLALCLVSQGCSSRVDSHVGKIFVDDLPPMENRTRQEMTTEPEKGVLAQCKSVIAQSDRLKSELPQTLLELDQWISSFEEQIRSILLRPLTSSDPAVHKESEICQVMGDDLLKSVFSSQKTYQWLQHQLKELTEQNPIQIRLAQKWLRRCLDLGTDHPPAQLTNVVERVEKNRELEHAFFKTLHRHSPPTLTLSSAELAGVPESIYSTLKVAQDGKFLVPVNQFHYDLILSQAQTSSTREAMFKAYQNLGGREALHLIEKARKVRAELATLHEKSSWSEFQASRSQAGSSLRVSEFLGLTQNQLAPVLATELKELRELKLKQLGEGDLNPWDLGYLKASIRPVATAITRAVAPTFISSLEVLSSLFELTVSEVTDPREKTAMRSFVLLDRGHPIARLSVLLGLPLDLLHAKRKGEIRFYPLASSRLLEDGRYQIPTSMLTVRLDQLNHSDLVKLFRELGSFFHHSLSSSTYGVLAGSQVSPEFRFAIDQVFEAYAWLPVVISKTLQLAPDQAASVANYRDHWRGLESSLMLAEAVTDQSLHLPLDSEEANQLAGIIFQETLGLKVSEPLNWIQVLGPSMRRGGGLAFTELWGITDSQRMIKKLHGVNPLVPTEVSKKFRKEVLEMADQQPAQELIKNFSR